jgi:transcriptional regulator with XRE-family HTH domain
MNIGATIKCLRMRKGMSHGDIERHSRLRPCYLSRVEHGHTTPSVETLARIAEAMEIPLAEFFSESGSPEGNSGVLRLRENTHFLRQIRHYVACLNDSDRKLVLAMMRNLAAKSSVPRVTCPLIPEKGPPTLISSTPLPPTDGPSKHCA